jgi:hypothetical protein
MSLLNVYVPDGEVSLECECDDEQDGGAHGDVHEWHREPAHVRQKT